MQIAGREGGAFELRSHLASGASSQAWLARRADGLVAVLKTLRWQDQPGHELAIEEQILRQLRCKNLVKFLGRGEREGRAVLAYERVFDNPLLVLSQPSIRARLPRDPGTRHYPLPPRMALALAADLLRAIEHMHGLGFVHCDVKPQNLMMRLVDLEREEVVPPERLAALCARSMAPSALGSRDSPTGVLIDIGATRSLGFLDELNRGEVDPSIVPPQLTPNHAPPEALLGKAGQARPFLDPSLDVYAAALVVYAAVSGCGPYDHEGEEPRGLQALLAVKAREREGKLQPISYRAVTSAPGIDRGLASDLFLLLKLCVSRSIVERPSARQAREKLEALGAAHGVPAPPALQPSPRAKPKLP